MPRADTTVPRKCKETMPKTSRCVPDANPSTVYRRSATMNPLKQTARRVAACIRFWRSSRDADVVFGEFIRHDGPGGQSEGCFKFILADDAFFLRCWDAPPQTLDLAFRGCARSWIRDEPGRHRTDKRQCPGDHGPHRDRVGAVQLQTQRARALREFRGVCLSREFLPLLAGVARLHDSQQRRVGSVGGVPRTPSRLPGSSAIWRLAADERDPLDLERRSPEADWRSTLIMRSRSARSTKSSRGRRGCPPLQRRFRSSEVLISVSGWFCIRSPQGTRRSRCSSSSQRLMAKRVPASK